MDLKKLLGELGRRRETAYQTVLELARRAAAGSKRTPDLQAIETALTAAGVSAEEFADIAHKAAEKRRLTDLAATAATLEKRKAELQAVIRAADAELERAEEKHAETIGPCVWELEDIDAKLQQAADAEQRARQIVVDPQAAVEHGKLLREWTAAGGEVQRLADEVEYAETQRQEALGRARAAGPDEYKQRRATQEAEGLAGRKAHLEAELTRAQQRFDELGRRLEPLAARLAAV